MTDNIRDDQLRVALVSTTDRVPRRAAIATFALAMGLVAVYLVWIVDLVILLATGQSNQVPGGPHLRAWEQAKGLMPIVIPWWAYFVFVVGWAIVLAVLWRDRFYFAPWGRFAILFASPAASGWLALITGLATLTSGLYFEAEGLGWYPVPGLLLIVIAFVAFGRELAIRQENRRQVEKLREAAAARRRARKERA